MRRMDLDHTYFQPQNLLDVRHDVGGVPGMKASTRNQTSRLSPGVVGNPLVDLGAKANYFRCDVIDQHRPADAACIKIFQESLRRVTEFRDLIEIRTLMF